MQEAQNKTKGGANTSPNMWMNTIPRQVQLFLNENKDHLERWVGPDNKEYQIQNERGIGAVFPNNFVTLRIAGDIVEKLYLGCTPSQLEECVLSFDNPLGLAIFGKSEKSVVNVMYKKRPEQVEILKVRPALDLQIDEYLREWLFLNPEFYEKTLIPMSQRFYNNTFSKVYHDVVQEPDEIHTEMLIKESEKVTYNLIAPPIFPGRGVVGSLMTFHATGHPQFKTSQMLDTLDSDFSINIKSPLGDALLGAKKGEIVKYREGGRNISVTVERVDCNDVAKTYIRTQRQELSPELTEAVSVN